MEAKVKLGQKGHEYCETVYRHAFLISFLQKNFRTLYRSKEKNRHLTVTVNKIVNSHRNTESFCVRKQRTTISVCDLQGEHEKVN